MTNPTRSQKNNWRYGRKGNWQNHLTQNEMSLGVRISLSLPLMENDKESLLVKSAQKEKQTWEQVVAMPAVQAVLPKIDIKDLFSK